MNGRTYWVLLMIAVVFLSGCAAAMEERQQRQVQQTAEFEERLQDKQLELVEKRAAFDFACERDNLHVENVAFEVMHATDLDQASGVFIYGVEGCGRRATYVFAGPYPMLDYMQRIDGTDDGSEHFGGEAV